MADKEKKPKLGKAEKKLKKLKAPKAGSGRHWFKDFRAELKKVIKILETVKHTKLLLKSVMIQLTYI